MMRADEDKLSPAQLKRKGQRMKAQTLVDIVNTSGSLDEVLKRSDMTYGYLLTRCAILRRKGFEIKRFPKNNQMGINTWLRVNYPDIHQQWQQYKEDNHIVP